MKMKRWILLSSFIVFYISAYAATSQENRDESLLFVGVSPFGVHVPTLLTRPLNVGLYLGSNVMFGVEYGKVKDSDYEHKYLDENHSDGENGSSTTNVSGSYTNEGAYIRVFSGESSLYLLLAYHVRTWEGEGTLTRESGEAVGTMTFQSHIGTIGFGNMWQFDSGLTFGISWYCDSRILEQSIDYKITSNTGIPEDEVQEEIEDFGKFLNAVSGLFGVGIVTMGISF